MRAPPSSVIFLDVDGVLHSLYGQHVLEERCCALLELLLVRTGASLVLSSTWRMASDQVDLLNGMLTKRGLPLLYGCTRITTKAREEEICEWLDEHPWISSYVAIDVQDLQARRSESSLRLRGRTLCTNPELGLTLQDVETIVQMLGCTQAMPATSLLPPASDETLGRISTTTTYRMAEVPNPQEANYLLQQQQQVPAFEGCRISIDEPSPEPRNSVPLPNMDYYGGQARSPYLLAEGPKLQQQQHQQQPVWQGSEPTPPPSSASPLVPGQSGKSVALSAVPAGTPPGTASPRTPRSIPTLEQQMQAQRPPPLQEPNGPRFGSEPPHFNTPPPSFGAAVGVQQVLASTGVVMSPPASTQEAAGLPYSTQEFGQAGPPRSGHAVGGPSAPPSGQYVLLQAGGPPASTQEVVDRGSPQDLNPGAQAWRQQCAGAAPVAAIPEGLNLVTLCGNWLINGQADAVVNVCANGFTLYKGVHMGAQNDLVQGVVGGVPVIQRGDGWTVDPLRSNLERLVWTRPGEEDLLWVRQHRLPDGASTPPAPAGPRSATPVRTPRGSAVVPATVVATAPGHGSAIVPAGAISPVQMASAVVPAGIASPVGQAAVTPAQVQAALTNAQAASVSVPASVVVSPVASAVPSQPGSVAPSHVPSRAGSAAIPVRRTGSAAVPQHATAPTAVVQGGTVVQGQMGATGGGSVVVSQMAPTPGSVTIPAQANSGSAAVPGQMGYPALAQSGSAVAPPQAGSSVVVSQAGSVAIPAKMGSVVVPSNCGSAVAPAMIPAAAPAKIGSAIVPGSFHEEALAVVGAGQVVAVLECVEAAGLDVAHIPAPQRRLALRATNGPWQVGRRAHNDFFARLVPDAAFRTWIAPAHMELCWEPPGLRLRNLSESALMANGTRIPPGQVAHVANGSKLTLCCGDVTAPLLSFCVLIDPSLVQPTQAQSVSAQLAQELQQVPVSPRMQVQQPPSPVVRQVSRPLSEVAGQPAAVALAAPPSPAPSYRPQPQPQLQLRTQQDQQQQQLQMQQQLQQQQQQQQVLMQEQRSPLVQMQQTQQPAQMDFQGQQHVHHEVNTLQQFHLQQAASHNHHKLGRSPASRRASRDAQCLAPCSEDSSSSSSASSAPAGSREVLPLPAGVPEAAAYVLICKYVRGSGVPPVQDDTRTIHVPVDSPVVVGRQHQPTVFDSLLGNDQTLLSFISRNHVQLSPVPGAPGTFEVTNLSANPVCAGQQRLERDQRCLAAPPTELGFLACFSAAAPVPEVFLKFSFEALDVALPMSPQRNGPAMWLELGGTALRDAVPADDRRITDTGDVLVVGRAVQQYLHVKALKESMLQWVSREHFRLERHGGGYQLAAMSANPMWLVRKGYRKEVKHLQSQEVLDNDTLMLFTGALDGTPDGPGSAGTLYWTFHTEAPSVWQLGN